MQDFIFTVTSLTQTIKNLLENQQTFKGFVLKGEISNFTHHRSGHLYFALKDENAQIRAIMFATQASRLTFKPKDGDKVTVTGSISLYAPQGSYNVSVSSMKLDGTGELYEKYLKLKDDLKKLGWFDKPKKVIPKYPKSIGVVTSATGAVIQDIRNTVNRRYKLAEVILYPASVQGSGASETIARQIKKANEDNKVDLLIVGRGGGSIEDLWAFNELETITAIYHSNLPIITAIGHETDDTISDLVSDLRAPTPTAAAELATPNTIDILLSLKKSEESLTNSLTNLINNYQNVLLNHLNRLEVSSPKNKLNQMHDKLKTNKNLLNTYFNHLLNSNLSKLESLNLKIKKFEPSQLINRNNDKINNLLVNLTNNYKYIVDSKKYQFTNNLNILEKVNPLAIMKRGYTFTEIDGKIIKSAKDVTTGEELKVIYHDGSLITKVIKKEEK